MFHVQLLVVCTVHWQVGCKILDLHQYELSQGIYLHIHFLKIALVTTEASFDGKATNETYLVKASVIAKMYFLLFPDVHRGPYKFQWILMLSSVGKGRGVSSFGDDNRFLFLS